MYIQVKTKKKSEMSNNSAFQEMNNVGLSYGVVNDSSIQRFKSPYAMPRVDIRGGRKKKESCHQSKNESIGNICSDILLQRMVIGVGDINDEAVEVSMENIKNRYHGWLNDRLPKTIQPAQLGEYLDLLKLNNTVIGREENLMIIGHGSESQANFFKNKKPMFAGMTGEQLAKKVLGIIPEDYRGKIFLNGCFTGLRRNFVDKGTSFIEVFGSAMSNNSGKFIVTGNIGLAETMKTGDELITLDSKLAELLINAGVSAGSYIPHDPDDEDDLQGWHQPCINTFGNKYTVSGLDGQAYFLVNKGYYFGPLIGKIQGR